MVDVILLITTIVLSSLIVLSSVYFLVYFQHPDDKWMAWFPKLIVICGVSLCCFNVLLLPLDVANHSGQARAVGGLPMEEISGYLYFITVIMASLIVPFTMFYYEAGDEKDDYEDPSITKKVFYAVKWVAVTFVFFIGGIVLMWWFIGFAEFEYDEITTAFVYAGISPQAGNPNLDYCANNGGGTYVQDKTLRVPVSAIMYLVAIASLIGWVLFAFFGGVGIPALPLDMLIEFKHRPRPIKLQEYTDKKRLIGEQATLLLQASQAFDDEKKKTSSTSRKGRKLKATENEFKKDVMYLESQWRRLEDAYKNGGGNPLMHLFRFLGGIIGFFLSLFWFLHIIIYVLPIQTPGVGTGLDLFLNTFFESTFQAPIVGLVFYGLFTFWLLLCVIKGTIKLGLRFAFITIHPMKIGETFMSSLIFNVGLMLFSSLAVSQFCAIAFSSYARYTSTLKLFGNSLTQLLYIKWIFFALMFILPAVIVVTTCYLTVKPYDYAKKPII